MSCNTYTTEWMTAHDLAKVIGCSRLAINAQERKNREQPDWKPCKGHFIGITLERRDITDADQSGVGRKGGRNRAYMYRATGIKRKAEATPEPEPDAPEERQWENPPLESIAKVVTPFGSTARTRLKIEVEEPSDDVKFASGQFNVGPPPTKFHQLNTYASATAVENERLTDENANLRAMIEALHRGQNELRQSMATGVEFGERMQAGLRASDKILRGWYNNFVKMELERDRVQTELDECVSTNVNCIASIERLTDEIASEKRRHIATSERLTMMRNELNSGPDFEQVAYNFIDSSFELTGELRDAEAELEALKADTLRLEQARCAAQKIADSKTKECDELTDANAALSKVRYAMWLELKEARKCEADLLANVEELCTENGKLHLRLQRRAKGLRLSFGPLKIEVAP